MEALWTSTVGSVAVHFEISHRRKLRQLTAMPNPKKQLKVPLESTESLKSKIDQERQELDRAMHARHPDN